MTDNDKLKNLQLKAIAITLRASPWIAEVLRLYPHLIAEDVLSIQCGCDLSQSRLAYLAEVTAIPECNILYIAHQQIRLDFNDYTDYYESLLTGYQRAGLSDNRLNSFILDPVHGGRLFVLHGTLHIWDEFGGELNELIIEPDSEEDCMPDVVEGFLVSKGLAFPTSVALLTATLDQTWPEWQSLWKLF